ncbi:MAG: carbamoylphosphate synthase large subunit [Lachnospiraceae bacterium]|nr:carbamoylphosphate synthase large subunit [Lachnospiraceae bacterium]
MKNFIFISPNFPVNYWQFCDRLAKNGINVLGIGDCPYDELDNGLKKALKEYYKVGNLENYDEVYRAVAFLTFRHGRIDWIESNNEYWLERDARLRTDFNLNTGFKLEDMPRIKYKSKMKEYYRQAGIPAARYHMVDDRKGCLSFIAEIGYPVIVKPDNGVGANHTCRISCDEELDHFLETKLPVSYIMEECVNGQICSYDAIVDSQGNPIFESGNVTGTSIMDIVNEGMDSHYYIEKELPEEVRQAGRKTVKSFGAKSRFVHLEFFRLLEDQASLGKKGDIVALEVNMRPSGGYSPEMLNYANGTDVYKIWADMIAYDSTQYPQMGHYYCAFVGRRDYGSYAMDDNSLIGKYALEMCQCGRIPDALSGAMGNRMFIAKFDSYDMMEEFFEDAMRSGC